MAVDPAKLSFFYFLYYINKCGGITQLGDGDGGAQSFRLKG
jgi:monoamine oxidase